MMSACIAADSTLHPRRSSRATGSRVAGNRRRLRSGVISVARTTGFVRVAISTASPPGRGVHSPVIRLMTLEGFVPPLKRDAGGAGWPRPRLWSPSLRLLLRRRGRRTIAARRVLRRNTDDLHTSTARDVHRIDDVGVFDARHTLHEDDLLGARIVDAFQFTGKLRPRHLLRVDGVLPARIHLE